MTTLASLLSPRALAVELGVPPRILDAIVANPAEHYLPPFFLERGPGRAARRIDRPKPILKTIQRRVHKRILKEVRVPQYLHGGLPGKSTRSLAVNHQAADCVVTVDVRDFFPSISQGAVETVLRCELGLSRGISRHLSKIVTLPIGVDVQDTFLPQGSPTSSTLANLVLLAPERSIREVAETLRLRYDRYLDDIVISGRLARRIIPVIVKTLKAHGFEISRQKLRVMSSGESQRVLGLTVNRQAAPSPEFRATAFALVDRIRSSSDQMLREAGIRSLRGKLSYASGFRCQFSRRLKKRIEILSSESPP